jgi:acyl dehydratase
MLQVSSAAKAPEIGDALPVLEVVIGRSDIVAMSLATRDFHPVHHDVDAARALGHPNLFINIMTTAALIERFIRQWRGSVGRVASLALKLGVPHYAGEMLVLKGEVSTVAQRPDGLCWVEVTFVGSNPRGQHASGQVRLELPGVHGQ